MPDVKNIVESMHKLGEAAKKADKSFRKLITTTKPTEMCLYVDGLTGKRRWRWRVKLDG